MCGRYALGLRAAFVRYQLQQQNMPVEEAPEDDEVRETYNFAPGYHGLVYRADVPFYGAGPSSRHRAGEADDMAEDARPTQSQESTSSQTTEETKYKLQAMRWGLIPFWTKRNPDYGSMMKTINCRDDSLAQSGGMWHSMKNKKRCIVVAQGFYEWLKKNNGKEKIPHYVKRKDGKLMLFAGLWDCVLYEGSEDKVYTYSIVTTDSNKQLKFLHDRMPVILENGSEQIRTWLDPGRYEWSKDLQSLLKPWDGELECYPVDKAVGKVGNNSPDFVVPVASRENKHNIANFFANAENKTKAGSPNKTQNDEDATKDLKLVDQPVSEHRDTDTISGSEHNAPMPDEPDKPATSQKRKLDDAEFVDSKKGASPIRKTPKTEHESSLLPKTSSPLKGKQTRSATSNKATAKASPAKAKDGSQRITNFFVK